MSKTVKKLLSVVLAVLVLAAGFSTMLGSFVMAEPEWTYDYQALIPQYVGTERDHELLKHNLQVSDGSILVPAELGFYDIASVATNARTGGGGLWSEGKDANGNPGTVVTNTMGLRVSDTFFLNGNENRWYVTNRENIDDARAYVTYEVNAGSEFRIQYLTYTEAQWSNFNLSSKELRLLDILVSADSVNWVPAKVENDIAYDAVEGASYDRVTATVANVGANTRFVKVQFPANPHTVTYRQDKGQWVKNYYPQDAWFLTKVALEAPVAANTTETIVNFKDVDTDGTTVITTVNGVKTAPADVFHSYGKLVQKAYGLVAYGDALWQSGTWQNKLTWGQIAESEREFFLLAQPGTRFNLTFTNYNGHDDIAKGLVGAGNIETTDDFAVKVFTAATKQDFAKGNYTEHKMVPALQNDGNGFFGTYNFIIPEGHIYVRILHPVSGAIGSVMKLNEDGTPMEYLEANAINNTAGNDWVHIKGITYTAPVLGTTVDDYKTNGWANAHGEYHNLHWVSGKQGLAQPANTGGAPVNILPTADDATDTRRTDDELAYAVYNVQPGTVFSADLFVRWGGNDWGKSKYDAVAAAVENGLEEFYFEFLGSADGLTYDTITTLGKTGDEYVKSTAKNDYNVKIAVPADVKYIKILSHFRGGYKSGSNWCVHDDNFAIKGVAFTPYAEAGAETYTYAGNLYTDSASYACTEADFGATTGSVAAGNGLKLFTVNASRSGLGIAYQGRTDATRAYVTYAVKPGTVFKFHYFIDANNKKRSEAINNRPFEFMVSSASTLTGTYTRFTQTNTHTTEALAYSFVVPEGANFIKIELPQSSTAITDASGTAYLNHDAFLRDVTYVPAGYVENATTFNYANATVASVKDNVSQFGAINASSWDLKLISGAVRYENFSTCIEKVGDSYVAKLDKEWGKVERPYIIYEVMPGTTFAADIFFHTNRTKINDTWLPAALEAGLITDESKFEFTFEASATADGGWKNAADTSALASNATSTMTYDVPADCKYVKITFPQRGAVIQNTTSVATDGNDVLRYAAAAMNDMASIKGVSYVPADADVVIENNYAAKGELADNTKSDYEIYDFDKVVSSANGIVAEADDAYVTYKVSNAEKLVLKSDDALKFAVSYDNDKFVDAQVYAYGGVYTIDTLDGKQYVKVALSAGDEITAVSAAALNPTVTFVVPHMNKEVNVDVPYYGAAAIEPEVTARLGYEFDGWSKAIDAVWFDVETVYQYKKAAADITVAVDQSFGDGTAKISQVAGNPVDSASATVQFNDRVVVEAPAACEGLVFDKWVDADSGKVISNSHKFSFLASESITLQAHYNENKTAIEEPIYTNKTAPYTVNSNGSWNMSVLWRINTVGNVTETGILIAKTADALSDDAACDSVVNGTETDTIKKRAHTNSAVGTTLMYTITKIADGQVRYALPYAIIDGDIYYGEVLSQTYTAAE